MNYKVRYYKSAVETQLVVLEPLLQKLVKNIIKEYLTSKPETVGKAILHWPNHRRLRIADHRVIYHVDRSERVVTIVGILSQREIFNIL